MAVTRRDSTRIRGLYTCSTEGGVWGHGEPHKTGSDPKETMQRAAHLISFEAVCTTWLQAAEMSDEYEAAFSIFAAVSCTVLCLSGDFQQQTQMIMADKERLVKTGEMGRRAGWGLTFCLANPGSITNTTPSMVSDVSAMFVDTTTCGNQNRWVQKGSPDPVRSSGRLANPSSSIQTQRTAVSFCRRHLLIVQVFRRASCNQKEQLTNQRNSSARVRGGNLVQRSALL